MINQLHKAQVSILYALRHAKSARFSALMKPTGLESDTFKFHLQKLTKSGYVEKSVIGEYELSDLGKEYANNLDDAKRSIQRQPKLSVLIIVLKPGAQGEPVYLFQKRRRKPFFDYWSCIGGPILWGEQAEEIAEKELMKQTGLSAVCQVRAIYRKRDFQAESDNLLEDKLFIIMEATDVQGELVNTWHGGINRWMTVNEFASKTKHFQSVCDAIEMLKTGSMYMTQDAKYRSEEY